MTKVHQFVPTLEPGAVGNHVLQVHRVLEGHGLAGGIYAEHVRPAVAAHGRVHREYRPSPGDILLYHMAIGSPVADFVLEQGVPVVVNHHNVTPASFWTGWQPELVLAAALARRQLADLVPRTKLGIADSAFNERELIDLGCASTAVAPVLIDLESLERPDVPDLRAGRTTWLFVGRVAPNKAQHDLIKAFAVYRRVYDGDALLRIVGGIASARYADALTGLIGDLGLDGAVELTGGVDEATLAGHFRAADVFVCVSDHEGFCVPVVEAMHVDVPVVAYATTAVGDTVGRGGLLLHDKAPSTVAAAVWRVLSDHGLRGELVDAGRARVSELALDVTGPRFYDALERVLP